jgi:hypothetical protein
MDNYTRHAIKHLRVPGYRMEAMRSLLVYFCMWATNNRFIVVLRWLGLRRLLFSGLPLTEQEIAHGQAFAKRLGLECSKERHP